MKINFYVIYFSLSLSIVVSSLISCGYEEIPVYRIYSDESGIVKTYFSESGDTLISVGLDSDSIYSGSYKLHLSQSKLRMEVNIKDKLPNGRIAIVDEDGLVFIQGYFLHGQQHSQWLFFSKSADSLISEKEHNFFHGRPFGREINKKPGEDNFEYILWNSEQALGRGRGHDGSFLFQGGKLNFLEYVSTDYSAVEQDLVLFVADVPGHFVEVLILDEENGVPILKEIHADGWMNGMWYYRVKSMELMSSLRVKTLDIKILDKYRRDVYRDFVMLPLVY